MNQYAAEVHHLADTLSVCHAFDAKMKADLFASAVRVGRGVFLVDPFAVNRETFSEFVNAQPVAGIIVTNENHVRASGDLAQRLSAPIYADPTATVPESSDIAGLDADFDVMPIAGAAAGEIALYLKDSGGTVVIGDALINFGSHGFALLPPKYCTDPKLMRKSLRQLLDRKFERMLFAHGTPILTRARDRLASLLEAEA